MNSRKNRAQIGKATRWVIKIGSALLTDNGRGLDMQAIHLWVEQMTALRQRGCELVLVSSGAVAAGMNRLGWHGRPHELVSLQAAAAVGQMSLVQAYESNFQRHGLHTAQVLLTHDDLVNRTRYLNARSTLRKLLSLGVIPVVNENDSRDLKVASMRFKETPVEVSEVMHSPVVTIEPEGLLSEAAQQMIDNRIGGLPVLDANGEVAGILTETDLLRALIDQLGKDTV